VATVKATAKKRKRVRERQPGGVATRGVFMDLPSMDAIVNGASGCDSVVRVGAFVLQIGDGTRQVIIAGLRGKSTVEF
jgi:hypothetical protein